MGAVNVGMLKSSWLQVKDVFVYSVYRGEGARLNGLLCVGGGRKAERFTVRVKGDVVTQNGLQCVYVDGARLNDLECV